jgi:hypothetical protein
MVPSQSALEEQRPEVSAADFNPGHGAPVSADVFDGDPHVLSSSDAPCGPRGGFAIGLGRLQSIDPVEANRNLSSSRAAHIVCVAIGYLQEASRECLARVDLDLGRGRGGGPEEEKRAHKDASKEAPGVIHRGGDVSVECISPFSHPIGSMHSPDHASVLPGHVDPIPMPDSLLEAELLLLLLEVGLYPKIVPTGREKIRSDEG